MSHVLVPILRIRQLLLLPELSKQKSQNLYYKIKFFLTIDLVYPSGNSAKIAKKELFVLVFIEWFSVLGSFKLSYQVFLLEINSLCLIISKTLCKEYKNCKLNSYY